MSARCLSVHVIVSACVVCVCAYIVHVYVGYMSELGGSKVVYQNVTVIITSK